MAVGLTEIIAAAGPAHHAAFASTDGEDPEWPLWYADYLIDDVSDALGVQLTRSRLTYLLVDMDRQLSGAATDTPWPQYYAAELEHRRDAGTLL